jgi:hypothetical protein
MKKFFIGAAITGGAFVFLVIIVRLTGILQVYRGSTSAMSPAIELNEQFLHQILYNLNTTTLGKCKRCYGCCSG